MSNLTIKADVPEPAPPEDRDDAPKPDQVEVGQWFWFTPQPEDDDAPDEPEDEPDEPEDAPDEPEDAPEPEDEPEDDAPEAAWLGCVTRIGSNYVEVTEPSRDRYSSRQVRVHFDEFYDYCTWVPNAQEVIAGYLAHHRSRLDNLMLQMAEVTARLGVAPSRELHAGAGDATALSTSLSGRSYGDYKADLVKAKKEELPAIFDAIKGEHAQLAKWMSAELLPLRSKLRDLESVKAVISNRIFNVELYAGLVEQVVQVRDGEPAALTEKVSLLQRRLYMDEECLARYEAGGMQFKHIEEFDAWIARDANMKRLLPFERCIVAFRVRRRDIEREVNSLSDWIQLWYERKDDARTYLYIRNGEKLYRMSTGIDFGYDLFPDVAKFTQPPGTRMWAVYGRHEDVIEDLITDADHAERVAAWKARVAERDRRYREWQARRAKATPEEIEADYELRWFSDDHGLHSDEPKHEPFDKTSVYYDDIARWRQDQIDAHNRVALVLQGLLDRSPCLHPHPPWQIWTSEGFEAGIRLVYDDDRALTPGAAPDFEAYRRELNASLKKGSMTVGQRAAWSRWRQERREDGEEVDYRDHGPPRVAEVQHYVKSRRTCTYAWERDAKRMKRGAWIPDPKRPGWGHYEWAYPKVSVKFDVSADEVLNVDAYRPGDFRRFFDDPRTRADYLEWAPFLLAAEEYHAGHKSGVPDEKGE